MSMESWRNLSQNGKTAKGKPVVLSPQLEDYDFFHYVRHPLKPISDEFHILLNVGYFEMNQIEVLVPNEGEVEIKAKHDTRKSSQGLVFSRDCVYRYVLPQEVAKRELIAHWTDDNFLLIQPTDSGSEENVKAPYRLVLERVPRLLKPSVDIRVLKEMVEDIRDKANYTLRYIRLQTYMPPENFDVNEIIAKSETVNFPVSEKASDDEKEASNAKSTEKNVCVTSNVNQIIATTEKAQNDLNEVIASSEENKSGEPTEISSAPDRGSRSQ